VAAAGPSKEQCIASNSDAQDLVREGKFSEARARLRECADPSCPALVRDDCTRRLDELERAQPTIIFDVKDGTGRDRRAVSVTVDGTLLVRELNGKPLPVDPGEHTFVVTAEGEKPVTRSFVLKVGEKERLERLTLGEPPQSDTAQARDAGLGTQRIVGIAVAGVGIAGVAVGAIFGLMASSAWSQAKGACGPDPSHCIDLTGANSFKSTTDSDATISTVAFIAGGVLLAGGAALFLTGGPKRSSATGARVWIAPSLGQDRAGAAVDGVF
jgi:hypothetical protein